MTYITTPPDYKVYPVSTFSGDAYTTVFSLPYNISGESTILVWVNGLKIDFNAYSINGNQLTFFRAPPIGNGNVEVFYLNLPALSTPNSSGVYSIDVNVNSLKGLVSTGGPVTYEGTIFLSGVLEVPSGGTGLASIPTGAVLTGGTTVRPDGSIPMIPVGPGIANQALVSAGAGASPSFTNIVNSIDGGNSGLTLVTTGTSTLANTGSLSIAGRLNPANGGTGSASATGTGSAVLSTNAVLITPNLGTPSSVVLTNGTGLNLTNAAGVTGTLPIANGGTGTTISTGTGSLVLSTSPSLTTPNLGTPTSGDLQNCTFGSWKISPNGATLSFLYNGTSVATLDSSGNFVAQGNVTAF